MSTISSLKAFFKPENQEKRKTHKQIILQVMQHGLPLSNRSIARFCSLNYSQVHKRTSELLQENKIVIAGNSTENGQTVSMYKLNKEPHLFVVKKLTLRQWLKVNHADILAKFDGLNK